MQYRLNICQDGAPDFVPFGARFHDWAHGVLLATLSGDATGVAVDQVRANASGGSARIQG